jgi:chaperone modulatory protein CbpM
MTTRFDDRLQNDKPQLTIDEIARACAVAPAWIVEHVEEGFIQCEVALVVTSVDEWRFANTDLVRARKLVAFERDFDLNPDVAALIVDLLEEISALKRDRLN